MINLGDSIYKEASDPNVNLGGYSFDTEFYISIFAIFISSSEANLLFADGIFHEENSILEDTLNG